MFEEIPRDMSVKYIRQLQDNSYVLYVRSDGSIGGSIYLSSADNGVRPVIVISTSEI